MTSNICGSSEIYENEIFKIVRVNRLKKNLITYIFVGNQDKEIKIILTHLENDDKLSEKEYSILKQHFKSNYQYIIKHKTKIIKFIYHGIYVDDTIQNIRKKIFVFLSTEKDILPEQNQELWVKMTANYFWILGPTWTNITIEPSILQPSILPDFKSFVTKDGKRILNEHIKHINDQTLFDATNGLKFEDREIFMNMMEDDIIFLKQKGQKIDQILIDGYFLKYYPRDNFPSEVIDYNAEYLFKNIEKLRGVMNAEDRLIQFVESIPIDESIFNGCKIIQVLLHITNPYEHEFIDLLKIFNLLSLDEKTPFMRYKDMEWAAPLYLFYKPLVENKIISEKQMKEWISATKKVKDATEHVIKEIQYSVRGLTIKRYIYTLDGEPKYATINIHRNGNMEIRISFKEKQQANLRDVYNALKDIGKLVSKINEIDYRFKQQKIPANVKLLEPDVSFNDAKNLIEFHGKTRLILIDVINGVAIPEDFNYREMNEFANKYFTPFVSPVLSKKDYERNELLMKFKRVSYYSKMNIEYEFIHKTIMQNPNIPRKNIIQLLWENYYSGKPIEEAIRVFQNWEKKYGYMGSQGVKGARQTGVEIKIKHGKIHLNSSKNIMQMTNASVFIAKFLNIYFNKSKFLKKSEMKDIFSDELAKIKDDSNDSNINPNDVNITNKEYLNYDFNNTLGNIYGNDEYIDSTIAANINNEEENENSMIINKNKNKFDFNRAKYLATDEEIDRNIRMQCEDKDLKKDVCSDFCEDEFYALRRLQKYDNPVFRFRSDPKFDNFARQCQPQERQPLVMRFDPTQNPNVDPKSYANAVKFGSSSDRQNWYMCAQVWCPYEEIPILYDSIKDNIIKRKISRKGYCLTAQCPSCLKQKKTTWLRIVEDSKFHPYLGFIDDSNHPNHLCMPCCYRKPMDNPKAKGYSKFMKCLGKNVDSSVESESADYIMGRDKMPLTKGRYGLLPVNLAKLFKSRCDTGKMRSNTSCFLRYGVKDDINQSFLQAIIGVVETDQPISITVLKKYLFETKMTKRLFNSLNHGELAILFDNKKDDPYENFIKYMMSDTQKITEEFLWDFLQRPGILDKNGVNLFIMTSRSLLCPKGFEIDKFYNSTKKSIIIMTDGRYYEPIFMAINQNGSLKPPIKFFEPNIANIIQLMNIALTNCMMKDIVNWDKIRKISLSTKYFELSTPISAIELMKKMTVIGQLKDSYNKIYALLSENGFQLPIYPQGEILELDIIENWKPKKIGETIKFYEIISEKYELPYKPKKIFKEQNGKIIAIQLADNSIIPTQEEFPNSISTKLMEASDKYYYNVNTHLAKGNKNLDERSKTTLYIIYIQESYDRLRMELARKLQKIPEKAKIIQLINDKAMPIKLKREYMKSLLGKLCKSFIIQMQKLPFPIQNYIKPTLRKPCTNEKKCEMNPHCYFHEGECKLIILEKNPIDDTNIFDFFMERISDEILRNRLLRDEILEDKLDELINKSVEKRNDEIIINGAKNLLAQVSELYKPKKEFILREENMYSTTQPDYKGVNKNKYLIQSHDITLDSSKLLVLPSYWKTIMGNKFRYYDAKILNNSLYYAILRIIQIIQPEIKNITDLKKLEINKIEHIFKEDINNDYYFKDIQPDIIDGITRIIAIFKETNRPQYKNVNTMTQLKEFIMSDEYPANFVDVYLLSLALGINIIILEKRITKKNTNGFYIFTQNVKKDYIFLFNNSKLEENNYNIVGKQNNYIFKIKDLPKIIKKFIGIEDNTNSNNQPQVPKELQIGNKKMIKIKK
jgi:hypothetical protein